MSTRSKRLLGNFLIYGVSLPAVLVILVLALVAKPWAGGESATAYWLFPILLVGMLAAHTGSRVKAAAKA